MFFSSKVLTVTEIRTYGQNAVWITIFFAVVLSINFLGTRAFGECEFWFGGFSSYNTYVYSVLKVTFFFFWQPQ